MTGPDALHRAALRRAHGFAVWSGIIWLGVGVYFTLILRPVPAPADVPPTLVCGTAWRAPPIREPEMFR